MGSIALTQTIKGIVGEDNVKCNEPMKYHTSFKIGGPADILVTPKNTDELSQIIKLCLNEATPYFVIGNGTNLVVRDKGIRGVVIKLYDNFCHYSVNNDEIEVYAGMLLSKVANVALEHSLKGLEFASGIPGTIGGAVAMNAGAYDGEMKDVVVRTEYLDKYGDVKVLEGQEHCFGYRTSFIQTEGGIVLKSVLKLKHGDKKEIKAKMDDLNQRRSDKQPLELPSAGSVFKRPEGYFAGKLIEDCGLRGYCVGDAQVSSKHCGFIVNIGSATSCDVTNLIRHIQGQVKEKFGVDMYTEVRIVGEE